jgi:hypothetical protein
VTRWLSFFKLAFDIRSQGVTSTASTFRGTDAHDLMSDLNGVTTE